MRVRHKHRTTIPTAMLWVRGRGGGDRDRVAREAAAIEQHFASSGELDEAWSDSDLPESSTRKERGELDAEGESQEF